MFSSHNGMKLEVSNRWKTRKFINVWKVNNTLLDNLAIMNQEEIGNLKGSFMSKEIETVIKNLPTKKTPGPDDFTKHLE